MKVSIVTTVFNRKDSIERALESVHSQSYENIEHIIIDGLSNDGTKEIISNFIKDKNNIIFKSEKDNGIYDAINKGISLAKGEIIGLMHSDDFYFNNNVVSEIAESFINNDIDAVYADAVYFNKSDPSKIIRRYKSKKFNKNKLAWGLMPAHTTLYLRNNVFKTHGKYKINYNIASDFEFVARIFNSDNFKSKYIEKPWVKMQSGGASTSGVKSNLTINREVMRACKENNIYTNRLMIYTKYLSKLLEFIIK